MSEERLTPTSFQSLTRTRRESPLAMSRFDLSPSHRPSGSAPRAGRELGKTVGSASVARSSAASSRTPARSRPRRSGRRCSIFRDRAARDVRRLYTVKENITAEDLLFRCHVVIQGEIETVRLQMRRTASPSCSGTASFTGPPPALRDGPGRNDRSGGRQDRHRDGLQPGSAPVPVDGETIIDSDALLKPEEAAEVADRRRRGVIGTEYARCSRHSASR